MHLTVHERIRVVELYNRLDNHLSFTKRSIIVSKLAEKDYKIKISFVTDLIYWKDMFQLMTINFFKIKKIVENGSSFKPIYQ